jgi:hypothetical protein
MFSNLKRNWWRVVVIAQATLGLLAAVSSVWGLVADATPEHAEFRIMSIIVSSVGSAVLLGGLAVLGRNRQAGSWMIVAASVPTLLTLLALNPIALLALATVVGGFWTGNLALATQSTGIDLTRPDGSPAPARGGSWYRWLIAAALLIAFGLFVLAALEGTTNEFVDGLKWITWILSWAAAAAVAAVGVTLGIARLLARHRTRPA